MSESTENTARMVVEFIEATIDEAQTALSEARQLLEEVSGK